MNLGTSNLNPITPSLNIFTANQAGGAPCPVNAIVASTPFRSPCADFSTIFPYFCMMERAFWGLASFMPSIRSCSFLRSSETEKRPDWFLGNEPPASSVASGLRLRPLARRAAACSGLLIL